MISPLASHTDGVRCGEVHADAGQCQLVTPHADKPHAAVLPDGIVCWNHLELHRWSLYSVPKWILRFPWAQECKPELPTTDVSGYY